MTPEEKLLKLIRKKKPQGSSDVQKKQNDAADHIVPKNSRDLFKKTSGYDFLKLAQWALVIIIVGMAGLLGVKIFYVQNEEFVKGEQQKIVLSKKGITAKKIILPEAKSFSVYQEKIQSRNIFQAPWEKQTGQPNGASTVNIDFIKQFKLVGIVLDDDPKAIVEDPKTKQTFFLSAGESIENAVVEAIYSDKVIFLYNDERLELTQ